MGIRRHAIVLAVLLALLAVSAVGCMSSELESDEVTTTESTQPAEDTDIEQDGSAPVQPATYELVFDATWSRDTHPVDFPPNPHFSGLIGAVHGPDALLWADGMLATPGIKNMAETGGKDPLDVEVEAMIAEGTACELISGSGINPSPGMTSITFTVSEACPLVSVVSMIAPSPDWFVGVSALDMREGDAWAEEIVIELYPWDGGTDDGVNYSSANAPTVSPVPVFLMEPGPPIAVEGVIPPFGTYTFTKTEG